MSFKKWLVASVLLFSLGIVFGISVPSDTNVAAEELAAFEDMVGILASLPTALLVIFILFKNCLALLFSFFLSPLFCLVPIMTLTVNGWLVGVVAAEVTKNVSLGYLLAGILPHGIFEIPALMIGEAAAFGFGSSIFLSFLQKNKPGYLATSFKKNLRYLIIAMLLMVPAALIETFITPLFLS